MQVSSAYNRLSEGACEATESSKEFVAEHPMSTTLTAFGLGLGLGVALTFLMTNGASHHHQASLAQRVGRQVLDSLGRVVPDSLMHLGR